MKQIPWLLPALWLASCATHQNVPDLALNEKIYAPIAYETRAPGDRAVFVAPTRDARNPASYPASSNGFPISYEGDRRWYRPVPEMVDAVLLEELEESELFTAIKTTASPQDVVVQPTLITFVTGVMEQEYGARSIAEVGIRIEVLGPVGGDGTRPVLFDQVYGERQVSNPDRLPPSTYLLTGMCMRTTMQRMLAGLDGSNVGRSALSPTSLPAAPAPAPAK
jgi:uncharacterized lipoprotein YmbA